MEEYSDIMGDDGRSDAMKNFVQRLKVDDTLQGYTNREIADVVNDLLETEPGIVYKPMLGVSVVKKLLEGGRYMEPQEISRLIENSKGKACDSDQLDRMESILGETMNAIAWLMQTLVTGESSFISMPPQGPQGAPPSPPQGGMPSEGPPPAGPPPDAMGPAGPAEGQPQGGPLFSLLSK